jgi:hypothetical protein
MAKIPVYESNVQTQLSPNTSARMSGDDPVGQGLQQLGQGIAKVGEAVASFQSVIDQKNADVYELAFQDKVASLDSFVKGISTDKDGVTKLNVPYDQREQYIKTEMDEWNKEAFGSIKASGKAKEKISSFYQGNMIQMTKKARDEYMAFEMESAIAAKQQVYENWVITTNDLQQKGAGEEQIAGLKTVVDRHFQELSGLVGQANAVKYQQDAYTKYALYSIKTATSVEDLKNRVSKLDQSKMGSIDALSVLTTAESEETSLELQSIRAENEKKRIAEEVEKKETELKKQGLAVISNYITKLDAGEDVSALLPDVTGLIQANFPESEAKVLIEGISGLSKFEKIVPLKKTQQIAIEEKLIAANIEYTEEDDPKKQQEILAKILNMQGVTPSEKAFVAQQMIEISDTSWWLGRSGNKDKNGMNYLAERMRSIATASGSSEIYGKLFPYWQKIVEASANDFKGYEDQIDMSATDQEKTIQLIDHMTKADSDRASATALMVNKIMIFKNALFMNNQE